MHNQERSPDFATSPFDGQYRTNPEPAKYSNRDIDYGEQPSSKEAQFAQKYSENPMSRKRDSSYKNKGRDSRSNKAVKEQFNAVTLDSALAKNSILQMSDRELEQIFKMLDVKDLGYLSMDNFGYYKLPQHLMIQMGSLAKEVFASERGIGFQEFVRKLDL